MKIIGIDPGYERIGIAVLEKNKSEKKEILLYSTCFKTSSKFSMDERLLLIGKKIEEVITEWRPNILAIEKLYFENNAKTAMGVAEARGTIIYCAKRAGCTVLEYTPLQIKNAVTGYGKADKRSVHNMVSKLISLPKNIKQDDEIDAIAVAITGFATSQIE